MTNTITAKPLISQDKLENLFDGMSSPVVEWSPQGRILYANDAFGKLMGFGRDELIGESFYDAMLPGALRPQWDTVREGFLQLKATANHTMHMRDRRGETKSVSWTTVLKTTAAGELKSVIGLGLNLSGITAAVRELLYMASVLEAANGFISPSMPNDSL